MVWVGTPPTSCETFEIAATSAAQFRKHASRTVARVVALVVTLMLAAALVLVWLRVVSTLTEQIEPRPPIGQPRAIVWNNRVFTADSQLKRYLEAKGASYTRWVSKHPSAFAVLQHQLPASAMSTRDSARTVVRAKSRERQRATRSRASALSRVAAPKSNASAAPRTPVLPRAVADSRSSGGSSVSSITMLVASLACLETLLLVLALLPRRLAPIPLQRFYVVPERRIGLFAAAMAILFGLLVSLYLG